MNKVYFGLIVCLLLIGRSFGVAYEVGISGSVSKGQGNSACIASGAAGVYAGEGPDPYAWDVNYWAQRCGNDWDNFKNSVLIPSSPHTICEAPAVFYRGYPGLCECGSPFVLDGKVCSCPYGTLYSKEDNACKSPTVDIKNLGSSCPASGHPIFIGSGNKYLDQEDYTFGGVGAARFYNSESTGGFASIINRSGGVVYGGRGWVFRYFQHLKLSGATILWVLRPDGKVYTYQYVSASALWRSDADVDDTVTELKDVSSVRIGWRYVDAMNGQEETYDASGVLQEIRLRDGRLQTVVYSDGSDGTKTGLGGFVLDALGGA